MGRILSIDYGLKRIGLAFSDESETIAQALEPALANNGKTLWNLNRLIKKYQVGQVVIGLPKSLTGESGVAESRAKEFGRSLELSAGIKCRYLDERFTTVSAKNALDTHNIKKREYLKHIDNSSAQLLLQEYLDGRKSQ
ncbi:MAG: Holliday junction resolvase RuvX [bacterium]|nr:Holliday junction resolvase RuvX [bacterium]